MDRRDFPHQYQEIARVLREQIVRGDFREEGRLPSERNLVERFHVQRNTVRKALALLERDGQIAIETKRGAFLRSASNRVQGKSFLECVHTGQSASLTRLTQGFHRQAAESGFKVRMFDSHPPQGAALDPIPDVSTLDQDIAGVIVWPQNPTNVPALRKLRSALPLVLVDRRVAGLSSDCVRFADLAGGKMMADHLVSLGHRRIGFIADDVFAETVQQRWQGYVSSLEANGIPIDPRLSLFFHGIDAPYFAMAMRHLLNRGDEAPTAIMCSNDVVAFTLFRFLHDEGVRVPDDLAVAGYGNLLPDYVNALALTSVDQPFYELGQAAARILVERVGQTESERLRSPHDIEIPVRLVVRSSTQPAAD